MSTPPDLAIVTGANDPNMPEENDDPNIPPAEREPMTVFLASCGAAVSSACFTLHTLITPLQGLGMQMQFGSTTDAAVRRWGVGAVRAPPWYPHDIRHDMLSCEPYPPVQADP